MNKDAFHEAIYHILTLHTELQVDLMHLIKRIADTEQKLYELAHDAAPGLLPPMPGMMEDSDVRVIHRSEADIQSEADTKWRGDRDKVPTATTDMVTVYGIDMRSRYSKADELEDMIAIARRMPPSLRGAIITMWCDSKAGSCYSIGISPWDPLAAHCIGGEVRKTLLALRGGYNGITIHGDKCKFGILESRRIDFDPEWTADFEYDGGVSA